MYKNKQQRFSTSSRKRKNKAYRLPVIVILGIFLIGVVAYFYFPQNKNEEMVSPELNAAEINVVELWNNGDYTAILELTNKQLSQHPLSSSALAFRGYALFYLAMSQVSFEEKVLLLDEAIFSLRKSLFDPEKDLEIHSRYILGKAYYQKGKFYADLAINHLKYCKDQGYNASDLDETIGLAYFHVGEQEESLNYLKRADQKTPTSLMAYQIGEIYREMDDLSQAIHYFELAINRSEDLSLEERCKLALGHIYRDKEEWELAKSSYQRVVELNPDNVDGHFFLGEVYKSLGENEKARSEWRKTFRLDNNHYMARLRLYG